MSRGQKRPKVFCQDRMCSAYCTHQRSPHKHDQLARRYKLGEHTGLEDKKGEPIREGDILLEDYNEHYGKVPVVVLWDPEKGAWVSFGTFESGGAHESLNGEHFKDCERIGNIDLSPKKYGPARKLKRGRR